MYAIRSYYELAFSLNDKGIPVYELNYKGKTLIGQSEMGFMVHAGYNLQKNFKISQIETDTKDEIWHPVMSYNFV